MTELGITVFLHPNISVLVADSTIALQLFLESYTLFPLPTTMVVKPLQEPNAKSPIEVTELGMVIDVKPLQYSNARSPIEVTELGMLIDVKPLHQENAISPIEVTQPHHYVVLLLTILKIITTISYTYHTTSLKKSCTITTRAT